MKMRIRLKRALDRARRAVVLGRLPGGCGISATPVADIIGRWH